VIPSERDAAQGRWKPVLDALRRGYADAVLSGAEAEAERLIGEAIEAGMSEALICDEIIAPAMRAVGEQWALGLLSVADEHLATEISIRVLALQREAFRASRRRGSRRVVLTAVEGERHAIGLNMASSVLLHAGYDVRLLGPDLPLAELGSAVERHTPAVVGFSATVPALTSLLPEAIEEIRAVAPRAGVIIGGAAAPEALATQPGVVLCRHVGDAVELTDALVHRAPLN